MKMASLMLAMAITPFLGFIQWAIYDLFTTNYIIIALYNYIIFMMYYLGTIWLVEMQIKKLNLKSIQGVNKFLHCYISPLALSALGAALSYMYIISGDDKYFKISYLQIFIPIAIPVIIAAILTVNKYNRENIIP